MKIKKDVCYLEVCDGVSILTKTLGFMRLVQAESNIQTKSNNGALLGFQTFSNSSDTIRQC